ncbi:MAG: DUF935 family protein, partial [Bacteroidetes bacterium]|nr:DUF935 family protein [Bacteroidota bacterium]
IMAATNVDWVFLDKEGKEVDFMMEWIDSPDFELLVSEILNSKMWGYSMLEFDFYADGTWGIYNIPRKHMRPELGLVAFEQTANNGVFVREGNYANTVLEVGNEKDLGLLLSAAQYVIYKRGNFGDWAQFSEVFGMPLIDAVWDGYNEDQRVMLLEALEAMGSGGQLVRPAGTTVEFKQGAANNPNGDLYKNFIETCNAEISKLILGQTETTESSESSGYAQASIHAGTENDINRNDRNFIRRNLNRRVCKILEVNGVDIKGGYFAIKNDNEEYVSKKERLEMDIRMKNEAKLPISDDYFYETYGIEKPEDYEKQKQDMKDKEEMQQFPPAFNMAFPTVKEKLSFIERLKSFL